jgi:ATP-dependent Clp protease ATP-binding subunit ClpA
MDIREVFSDVLVQALERAQDQARSLGHGYVGTEHVVVALAEAPGRVSSELATQGIAVEAVRDAVREIFNEHDWTRYVPDEEALATVGIDLASVTAAAEAEFGAGAIDVRRGNPGLTARLVRVCEQAIEEAEHDARLVNVDDLFAAMLLDDASVAVKVLERSGADVPGLIAAASRAG